MRSLLPAFAMSKYKVTNGEYLQFVRAGAKPPHFWRWHEGQWYWRGMWGEVPLPLDWPVYVTHEEACAFAAWTGKRLPTEAEFHRAAYGTVHGEEERSYPWGDDQPDRRAGKLRREPMGSYSRDCDPTWRQRIRNFPTGGQRMGVDVDGLPAFSRIPTPLVLSRLLGSLL